MTNELIKELVKSHVYGMTTAEMSEIYGLTEKEITEILTDNAAEIADEREYRDMLNGRENVPKTAPTPRAPARVSAANVKTYTGADLSVHNGAVNMAGVKQSGHSMRTMSVQQMQIGSSTEQAQPVRGGCAPLTALLLILCVTSLLPAHSTSMMLALRWAGRPLAKSQNLKIRPSGRWRKVIKCR